MSSEEKVSPDCARWRCTVRRSTPRLRATCSIEQRPVGSSTSISSRTRSGTVVSRGTAMASKYCRAYVRSCGSDIALGESRSPA
ncbi:hypothetical protein ACFQ1I_42345 [Kitasatospora arboriphila]